MTKTIAEQFDNEWDYRAYGTNKDAFHNAIERIEARLAQFDGAAIPSPSWMREIEERLDEKSKEGRVSVIETTVLRHISDLIKIEERITAIEHPNNKSEWLKTMREKYLAGGNENGN